VNSLTSSETELPYNYYSSPFCKPPEGVKKSINTINPGTILMGTVIENSPYNFSMLVRGCLASHSTAKPPLPPSRRHALMLAASMLARWRRRPSWRADRRASMAP
jgi:hypothetical protein